MRSSEGRKKMPLLIIASVILAASIVTACCLFSSSDDSVAETSGSCGASLTWSIEPSTGHLTITGTGAMDDYGPSSERWGGYTVRSVDLPDGLTTIGEYAFYQSRVLTSVTIPDSVTNIKEEAFSYCERLTAVSIGSNVSSIGNNAFCNCGLTSVTVPDSVTSIGAYSFSYCPALTTVVIGTGLSSMGNEPFLSCRSLESFTVAEMNTAYKSVDGVLFNKTGSYLIQYPASKVCETYNVPNTVTVIRPWAFKDSSALESVIMPNTVTSIKSNAFMNSSITAVTLSENLDDIEGYAFQGCINLTSITIPNGVTDIHPNTFDGCSSLTTAVIGSGVTNIGDRAFIRCGALTSLTIGPNVETIGDLAFAYCDSLISVTIPDSVTTVGVDVFMDCYALESIGIGTGLSSISTSLFTDCRSLQSITVAEMNVAYKSIDGILFNKTGTNLVCYPMGKACESYTVPDTVTAIGNMAFEGCSAVGSVIMPGSVTSVGHSAFRNSSITSVTIGPNVESIGAYSFQNAGLTSVTIPDSATDIHSSAFYGCRSLTSATIKASGGSISDYCFYDCSNLTSVTIDEGVTGIDTYAFCCTGLTSIAIPDSVTTIQSKVFDRCADLTSVTIGSSVTSLNLNAFDECNKLESFNVSPDNPSYSSQDGILFSVAGNVLMKCPVANDAGAYAVPNTVYEIRSGAFKGCSKLTSVTMPDCLSNIHSEAFMDCSNLTAVTIGSGMSSIDQRVFKNCSKLESITIPNNITVIRDEAFCGCTGLASVTIGSGVTSICPDSFRNCSSLTSVTIPDNVTSIGMGAFRLCDALTTVTIGSGVTSIGNSVFYGDKALESITVSGGNPAYSSQDGVLFDKGKTILIHYPSCKEGQSYTIPGTVTTVEDLAFSFNSTLTSIDIPDTVTDLRSGAFRESTALTTVTIGSGVTEIGSRTFYRCHNLTSVTIGSGVTAIGNAAFEQCYGLTSITIPDSVTMIYGSCFNECYGLTTVTLGSGVTQILDETFCDCINLTAITIPDNVTVIRPYAFSGCSRLSEVTIGSGTTSIASTAFNECPMIASFTVSNDNTAYKSVDGVLYTKDVTRLLKYPSAKGSATYSIPDTVIAIDEDAFYRCYGLTSVTVPDSVVAIPEDMFYHCPDLVSVTLGSGVNSIDLNAFFYTDRLESITVSADNIVYSSQDGVLFDKDKKTLIMYPIAKKGASYSVPATVTEIGYSSMCYCPELRTVTLPDGLKTISDYAFYKSCITSVTVPDSVTSIGDGAFEGCSYLTSATIGSGVTSIGTEVFHNCPRLESVTVSADNIVYSSQDGVLFDKDKKTMMQYPRAKDSKSYSIPDTVVLIVSYAFCNIPALTELTIPASLHDIGADTFVGLTGLKSVTVSDLNTRCCSVDGVLFDKDMKTLILYPSARTGSSYTIPDGIETISQIAFYNCVNLQTLTIPDSVTSEIYSFEGCRSLKALNVGSGVEGFHVEAFDTCYALESITVSNDSVTLSSVDGVLFSKDKTTLIVYPASKAGATYAIPDGTVAVSSCAFNNALKLESISVPADTELFNGMALYDTPNLRTVTVAEGNRTLMSADRVLCERTGTVIWCPTKWAGVLILNGDENPSTVEMNIPSCGDITGFQVRNPYLLSVRDGALYYKDTLIAYPAKNSASTFIVPKDAHTMSTTKFYNAENLTEITVAEGNTFCTSTDGALFDEFGQTLMACPAGKETFTLTSSVNYVSGMAFSGSILKKVTFKSGMSVTVQENAFSNCTSLLEIVIEDGADVKFVVNSIIFDDDAEHTIRVIAPKGYTIDTTLYRSNLNIIYGEPPGPIPPEPPTPPEPTGGGNNNAVIFIVVGVVAAIAVAGAAVFIVRRR